MDRSYALPLVEAEVARIVEVATHPNRELTAPVPTCPGWTSADLLNHLGRVYAMMATALSDELGNAPDRELIPRRAEGQDPLDWMLERSILLASLLGAIPEDAKRWNFVAGPRSPVSFWWRRQLHETLIHRVDAELSRKVPVATVEPWAGGDGVAEFLLLSGFREIPADDLQLGQGMTVHLHATDVQGAEWTIDTVGKTYARAHLKADVALRGPAWSLDRWVWRRGSAAPGGSLPLSDTEAFGDLLAAEEWRPAF